MKHLHFRFVTAGLALGLGVFLFLIVGWQARIMALPAGGHPLAIWLTAGLFLAAGSTLLVYGWHGVRAELAFGRKP